MQKKKPKIITIFFIFITIFLIGAIFYISKLLNGNENTASSVAPKKAKAANITYSKLIALNQSDAPTSAPNPSVDSGITPSSSDQRGLLGPTTAPTSGAQTTPGVQTPAPSETILAYANPSVSVTQPVEYNSTTTISPTKVTSMPETGYVYNGLIIFAASMVLVFFSFLF